MNKLSVAIVMNKIQYVRHIYHNAWFFSLVSCHVSARMCKSELSCERETDVCAPTHFTRVNRVGGVSNDFIIKILSFLIDMGKVSLHLYIKCSLGDQCFDESLRHNFLE